MTEQLLDDLLEEPALPGFRAGLLDEALRQARRRKRLRHVRNALTTTVCLGLFLLACWKWWPGAPGLDPGRRVNQEPSSSPAPGTVQIIATRLNSVRQVGSSEATAITVESSDSELPCSEVDDEGLLALLAGKPVALVRNGPSRAELIVLE